jgi:hypothetical protein
MPLTAQADGIDVVAFLLSDEQWELLGGSTLRTRCCGRPAHRRTSKLGTRHFMHHRRGECVTAPESAEHLALKERIALAVQAAGWDVLLEAAHGAFIVDVEARRGNNVVAFEVQWSPQTEAEYQRRSALYAEAGIELVWLIRPPGWNIAAVASARAVWLERPSGDEPVPTRVRIAGRYPPVVQQLEALVADVLEGRVSWREQVEMAEPMHALIVEIPENCWKCSRPVTGHLVGGVTACCGHFSPPPPCHEASGELVARVSKRGWLQGDAVMPIEWRATRTSGTSYFANVCPHCGSVSGDHFLASHLDENASARSGRPRGVYQVPCMPETVAALYDGIRPLIPRAHWCLSAAPPAEHELDQSTRWTADVAEVEVRDDITPEQAIRRMFRGSW